MRPRCGTRFAADVTAHGSECPPHGTPALQRDSVELLISRAALGHAWAKEFVRKPFIFEMQRRGEGGCVKTCAPGWAALRHCRRSECGEWTAAMGPPVIGLA